MKIYRITLAVCLTHRWFGTDSPVTLHKWIHNIIFVVRANDSLYLIAICFWEIMSVSDASLHHCVSQIQSCPEKNLAIVLCSFQNTRAHVRVVVGSTWSSVRSRTMTKKKCLIKINEKQLYVGCRSIHKQSLSVPTRVARIGSSDASTLTTTHSQADQSDLPHTSTHHRSILSPERGRLSTLSLPQSNVKMKSNMWFKTEKVCRRKNGLISWSFMFVLIHVVWFWFRLRVFVRCVSANICACWGFVAFLLFFFHFFCSFIFSSFRVARSWNNQQNTRSSERMRRRPQTGNGRRYEICKTWIK